MNTGAQVRRIVFTGDVLRPSAMPGGPPAADPSIQWLMRLLDWPLRQVSTLPISGAAWNRGFDTDAFYRAMDVAPDHAGWARLNFGAVDEAGLREAVRLLRQVCAKAPGGVRD